MLPGATAGGEQLPVYGAPDDLAAVPYVESEEAPRRRLLPLWVAVGVVAALLVGVAAVGALTRTPEPWMEDAYWGVRLPLPAAVEERPSEAWRYEVESSARLGLGDLVLVGDADTGDLVAMDGRRGTERWTLEPRTSDDRIEWLLPMGGGGALVAYRLHDGADGLHLVAVTSSGRVRWRGTKNDASFAFPLDGGGRVALFAESSPAGFVMLDGDDGRERWRSTEQPEGVGADVLYVTDEDGVRALDADTGERRWRRRRDATAGPLPVRSWGSEVDGTFVWVRGRNRLAGLSPISGEVRWTSSVDDRVWTVLDGGDVAIALGEAKAWGLDPGDGSILWSTEVEDWFAGPIIRMSGVEGVLVQSDELRRIDTRTGKLIGGGGRGTSSGLRPTGESATADGVVYIPDGGELRAMDAEELEERWTIEVESRHDVVAADDVVVAATRDALIAYR